MLSCQVALVTGASRGIGRRIAAQLAAHGATVIITGRLPQDSVKGQNSLEQTADEIRNLGGKVIVKFCDHSNMTEIKKLFEDIEKETQQLDILVNNAYSGVPYLAPNMNKRFYESDPDLWENINIVGLQNHYHCAVYATRMMISQGGRGLIVNLSSFGGIFSLFNAPYGIGKAGLDRMTREMAEELKSTKITTISLYPGAVRTEMFLENVLTNMEGNNNIKNIFDEGESPTFVGQAVAALASDPDRHQMNGRIVLTVDLAKKYGFTEINGQFNIPLPFGGIGITKNNENGNLELTGNTDVNFFGWGGRRNGKVVIGNGTFNIGQDDAAYVNGSEYGGANSFAIDKKTGIDVGSNLTLADRKAVGGLGKEQNFIETLLSALSGFGKNTNNNQRK